MHWPSLFPSAGHPKLKAFIVPYPFDSVADPTKSYFSELHILAGLRFTFTPFDADTEPPRLTFHTCGVKLHPTRTDVVLNDGTLLEASLRSPLLRHLLVYSSNLPLVISNVEDLSILTNAYHPMQPFFRSCSLHYYAHLISKLP